jgi:hypothetical protein
MNTAKLLERCRPVSHGITTHVVVAVGCKPVPELITPVRPRQSLNTCLRSVVRIAKRSEHAISDAGPMGPPGSAAFGTARPAGVIFGAHVCRLLMTREAREQ